MNTDEIVKEVQAEIGRLQNVVALLRGTATTQDHYKRTRGKRTMSAAARARISAAQKARWAKQKKANK